MRVRIIIDSTTDLLPATKSTLDVVPLTVHFGEEEYIDGVTMTHKQFYEKLVETDVLPHTSQASPAAFEKVYREVMAAGDSAVVLTLASQLSGTYQSAVIAAEGYENIHVVDSGSATIGAGVLAELALRLADEGLDAASIAQRLEAEKKKVRLIAMVDTLEYLKRGGRVSKTVAFAGGLLNIKPVISLTEGEIVLLGKARGSKQGNNLLAAEIEKAGGVDFDKPVLLGYTGLSDALLQKYIEDSRALWEGGRSELNTTIVGSVIGTHAGPGAIAAAFFAK
ncbi:MAG: DegV family protein [Oscillospiraceae bacterium]